MEKKEKLVGYEEKRFLLFDKNGTVDSHDEENKKTTYMIFYLLE